MKPLSVRFCEKASSTRSPRRFPSVRRDAGLTSPATSVGSSKMSLRPRVPCSSRSVSSFTVRETMPSTSPDSRRASCSPAAAASAGTPNSCASASSSVMPADSDFTVPLAWTVSRAQQLDVDGQAADARLGEEAQIRGDRARVREVEHEALDPIRVASQEDLAVRRRFDPADQAGPLRRAGDPQRARDLETAVVVVDADPFRRRQGQVETQRRQEVRRPRGGRDAALQQPVQQPAGEDDRFAVDAAEHVDAPRQHRSVRRAPATGARSIRSGARRDTRRRRPRPSA